MYNLVKKIVMGASVKDHDEEHYINIEHFEKFIREIRMRIQVARRKDEDNGESRLNVIKAFEFYLTEFSLINPVQILGALQSCEEKD